jgi:hypothetical protein
MNINYFINNHNMMKKFLIYARCKVIIISPNLKDINMVEEKLINKP